MKRSDIYFNTFQLSISKISFQQYVFKICQEDNLHSAFYTKCLDSRIYKENTFQFELATF